MSIQQSLINQIETTRQLGSSVYQLVLNKRDISRLGIELMDERYLSEDRRRLCWKMISTQTIEHGMKFMGVPIIGSGK